MLPRLLITLGDPAGIGPEVAWKAVRAAGELPLPVTLIGHRPALDTQGFDGPWVSPGALPDAGVSAIAVKGPPEIPLGRPTADSGRAAMAAIDAALALIDRGLAQALCTAPISKDALRMAGIPYTGHTSRLAAHAGCDVVMAFVGGGLRVSLATVHVPLREVPDRITPNHLRRVIATTARELGEPVGVLGLNPHAGEAGLFGREELDTIGPAIARARESGLDARGPLPPDTAFHRALGGEFASLCAMYHDQALCAVKTIAFHDVVNTTLGLPFTRTSPDHGTAFDIAGQDRANPSSMLAALRLAVQRITQDA